MKIEFMWLLRFEKCKNKSINLAEALLLQPRLSVYISTTYYHA